jgi:HEPN domain-containing protein
MIRILILAVVALLVGSAPPARGQCDLTAEIDRATQLIERAREAAARSSVPEARDLVRAARDRRDEAVDLGRNGRREMACRMARISQGFALKAVEIARSGLRGLDELERMLERSDQALRDAAGVVHDSRSPDAERMLRSAVRQQKESWEAFRGRRPRIAMKLTLTARETAARAVRVAEGKGVEDPGRVTAELGQTDRLLDEARAVLGGDAAPLERAARIQGIARRQLGRGHPGLALGLTQEARGAIRRALADANAAPDADDVEGMIATTAELVRRLEDEAVDQGNRGARDQLGRADALLAQARKALASQDLRGAFGDARAASSLALEVSEMLDGGDSK